MKEIKSPALSLLVLALAVAGIVIPVFSLQTAFVGSPSSDISRSNNSITLPATSFLRGVPGQTSLVATVDVKTLASNGHSTSPSAPLLKPAHGQPVPKGVGSNSAVKGTTSPLSVVGYTGFNGVNQLNSNCGCVPPDVQVAAGPSHVVEMVNSEGAVFTKAGASVQNFSLVSFFYAGNNYLSDPKILFDAPSGHWFASMIISSSPYFVTGNVTFAVSTGTDPTGTWNIYSVNPGNALPDQPIIGINDDKFVISANSYGANVTGAQIWVFSKNQLSAGVQSLSYTVFGPDEGYYSVHPVQSLSPTTTLYMVSTSTDAIVSGVNTVQLFSITGVPPATVTLQVSPLSIAAISDHVNPTQPGTSALINTDDTRVQDAAWFQGKLWYTLNEGCGTLSCIRLTQLDTTTLTVKQDFDFCPAKLYCFYPALRVDSLGNLAVIYGYSNSTVYPSLAVTGRAPSDAVNTLRTPITIVSGTASDTTGLYFTRPRYGDYFGAAVDPSDQTLVWVAGEFHSVATGNCTNSGNCWSTFIDSMRVTGPSFTVKASPVELGLTLGSNATSTITVTSQGGYTGTVSLSTSTISGGFSVSVNPSALNLTAGQFATSTLTIASTTSSPPGTFPLTVNATDGITTIPETVSAQLVGFSLTATPGAFSFAQGNSVTSTISLRGVNSFSGTISLTAGSSPAGPTVSLSSSSVTLSAGGSGTSTLTISTTSTGHGYFTISVTGTSGVQTATAQIPAAVTPLSVSVNNSTTFMGVRVRTVGTLTVDSPSNLVTFSGNIVVTGTNSSTGVTLSNQTFTLTKQPGTIFPLTVRTTPHSLLSTVTVYLSGASTGSSVGVTQDYDLNQDGSVNTPDLNIVAASFGCSVGQQCYNPLADINADGKVDVSDLVLVGAHFGMTTLVSDYSISASLSSLTISAGSSSGSVITLGSLNSFSGTVTLSKTIAPLGLTATLNTTSLVLNGIGSTKRASLTVSASQPGTYIVTITAASGVPSRSITVIANIVDFAFAANPTELDNFSVGGNSYLTLASLSGFSGTSTLSVVTSPSTGLTITLSPTILSTPSWGTGTSLLRVTHFVCDFRAHPAGCSWSITVTATSGSLTHTALLGFTACPLFGGVCTTAVGPQPASASNNLTGDVPQDLAIRARLEQ